MYFLGPCFVTMYKGVSQVRIRSKYIEDIDYVDIRSQLLSLLYVWEAIPHEFDAKV